MRAELCDFCGDPADPVYEDGNEVYYRCKCGFSWSEDKEERR